MTLVHRPADDPDDARVLATDVDRAESLVSRAVGLCFRRSIPDDYALVFSFDEPRPRALHMLFVPFPIDAVWIVDGEVTKTKRLRPVVGLGRGRADTVVELPAGGASAIDPGDAIELA